MIQLINMEHHFCREAGTNYSAGILYHTQGMGKRRKCKAEVS